MGSEATYPVGGDDPLFTTELSPLDIDALLAQIPDDPWNMEDLPRLDESAGHIPPDPQSTGHISPDPQSAGDTSHSTIAGLRQAVVYPLGSAVPTAATGAGILHQQSALMEWGSPGININPGLIQTQQEAPYSAGDIGTGTEELMPPPYSAGEPSAAAIPTAAAVQEIQSVEGARLEPNRLLANASFTQPDRYSDSAGGNSTGPSTTTTTEMGISSPDLEVVNNRARAGLSQPGGGAFTAERGSSSSTKRKCLDWSWREADLVRSDPSSSPDINSPTGSIDRTDMKPPDHSTPTEIIQFLCTERSKLCPSTERVLKVKVNRILAEQDQTAPEAHRRYVTTTIMKSELKTHHGYWKGKDFELVKTKRAGTIGVKRTLRFHTINDEETNWFVHEYIPLGRWGLDLFFEGLCFREVLQVPGKQRVNTNNRTAAVKHRMRGPDTMVVEGESAAWQHFIKIYDMHPKLEGSKVVYAVCCRCEGVLKAGTENGTKSLLTHCQRTCPDIKNKKQQPRSSR